MNLLCRAPQSKHYNCIKTFGWIRKSYKSSWNVNRGLVLIENWFSLLGYVLDLEVRSCAWVFSFRLRLKTHWVFVLFIFNLKLELVTTVNLAYPVTETQLLLVRQNVQTAPTFWVLQPLLLYETMCYCSRSQGGSQVK